MITQYWWIFLILFIILMTILIWLVYRLIQLKHVHLDLSDHTSDNLFIEENLLYTLIDNMPDFIYIKDKKSRFIIANKKLADVHGLKSPRMMKGKSDFNYYPKELANKFYWNEQEIMATGKPLINHEETGLDEKGNTIYVSTTKIPIKNKKREIIGIVGMGRDITARKKAEEKLLEHAEELEHANALLKERQEEIVQQSEELSAQADSFIQANRELDKLSVVARETDNVVILFDAEGNFEWVNQSFTNVYGYTLKQFVQAKGKNILQASFNPYIKDIMKKCNSTKKTIRYQSETVNKDGKPIWMQSTLTPILDKQKNIIRYVAVDSDITALKKAQEMINNQKKEIESQRDKLEKLNVTKDKFFSIIAHDLRNPFQSIMGFADLLVKNYAELEDQIKKEYIGLIYESSQYAHSLLENLLHWSRTQTDSIKYEPSEISIALIIDENLHMLHANIEKKGLSVTLKVDSNAKVYADKNMLDTVVRNLINNAVKFTPRGGKITIQSQDKKDFLVISITDTGVGIEAEDLHKLFHLETFHTTPGTEEESGTGLGLIICNEFVKKHGGEISVDSKPGKGTTFTFTLPKP
jgi:PAS domain S-box-containing protein